MAFCYQSGKPCWWHLCKINDNSNGVYVKNSFKKDDNNDNWNDLYITSNLKKMTIIIR